VSTFALLVLCVATWVGLFWLFWLPIYKRRLLDALASASESERSWLSTAELSALARVPRMVVHACLNGLEGDRMVLKRQEPGRLPTYRTTALGCQKLNTTNKLGWRKR
jgi:DNA-binding IclR family transcriptional regulator